MLPATEEEREYVTSYYLSQSPDGATVSFHQKVYSETIINHRHDVWDVHASDGLWWIITNPTNLYSQEQFPNMNLAVSLHMGICLRIPRSETQRPPDRNLLPFVAVIAQLNDMADALGQAGNLAGYQGIGVRCRETLLAFIATAQDAANGLRTRHRNAQTSVPGLKCSTMPPLPGPPRRSAAIY